MPAEKLHARVGVTLIRHDVRSLARADGAIKSPASRIPQRRIRGRDNDLEMDGRYLRVIIVYRITAPRYEVHSPAFSPSRLAILF